MLERYLSWKVLRLSLIIAFILSFAVLFIQLMKFTQVLSSLPFRESATFLGVWFFYLLIYFFPNALLISVAYNLFELKENKKLLVIESFGISKKKLVLRVLLLLLPILLSTFVSGFWITQEDISFLRRYSLYKYYSMLISSVPEKTFYKLEDMSIYMDKRTEKGARDVFFNSRDLTVFSEKASFREGSIVFEKGSILHREGDKTFVATFDKHTFNFQQFVNLKESKKDRKESLLVHVFNYFLLLPTMLLYLFLVIRYVSHHSTFYYLTAGISVLYQFFLVVIKNVF